jgi:hypothetical protein
MRVLFLLLFLSTATHAQSTQALIITGLAGEPAIENEMQRDAAALRDAITRRFGGTARVLTSSSSPRSDRAGLQQALAALAKTTAAGDRVLVVLIGHASAEGGEARFNIAGPDVTASELAGMLPASRDRNVAVVVATTSSGAFVPALSGSGRVIITATRSGAENEEVAFTRFFARALSEDGADSNKDGGVSLAEAFDYARSEVTRYYEQNKRLATEHALLDDNGDGKGSLNLDGADGTRAKLFVLRSGSSMIASDTVRALQARRAALETQIAGLKERKSSMAESAYDTQLEALLVQLARVNQAMRAAEGRK